MKINEKTFEPFCGGMLESTNLANLKVGHRGIVKDITSIDDTRFRFAFDRFYIGAGDVAGELGWRELRGLSWEIDLSEYMLNSIPATSDHGPRLQLLPRAADGDNFLLHSKSDVMHLASQVITKSPVELLADAVVPDGWLAILPKVPVGQDEEVIGVIDDLNLVRMLLLEHRLTPFSEGVRVGLKAHPMAKIVKEIIACQLKWLYGDKSTSVAVRHDGKNFVVVTKKEPQKD